MKKIQNIIDIKKSNIRIFPLQTKDHSFILFHDLMISYLLTLLIDRIGFNINQFSVDFVLPTKKYVRSLISNISNYKEEYFIFFLENYYHSNDFAFNFLEVVLDRLSLLKNPPKVIIYSLKAPKEELLLLFEKYEFVNLAIMCDIEYFFNEIFYKNTSIDEVENIIYRDDDLKINSNLSGKIEYDLNDYIIGAYHTKHYSNFYKSKDYISTFIDEDDDNTNKHIYYKRPKKDFILGYRYLKEDEVMLTTGRGCKYNCSYCYRGVKYSKLRQISLETIKKDLDYLKKMQYKYIYFYDDCFVTTNLDRMKELTDLLSNYDFEYGIAARYEVCTEENLEYLSKINIRRIQVGLQSVSFEVNKATKRGFRKENFEKTFKKMYEKGISVSLDIILGLPGEGLKGFLTTFQYAIKLKPMSIFINSLFLNPGTDLYLNKDNYGIKSNESNGKKNLFHVPSIYESSDFTKSDIDFARKYVSYYIDKLKNNIYIILR